MSAPLFPAAPARTPRWLVVHLAVFRLERCGYLPADLAVLVGDSHGAVRLCAVTPAAQEAGLWPGMSVHEARARLPEVVAEPLDAVAEARDWTSLLRSFDAFSDRVWSLTGDAVAVDLTHTSAAQGGEEAVLSQVVALCERLGHLASTAIADDPYAALALATHSPSSPIVAPPRGAASLLAPLPLASLRPPAELARLLGEIGVYTVGAFAALPLAAVSDRYGREAAHLHRVANGAPAEPVPGAAVLVVDPGTLVEGASLAEPTTTVAPLLLVLNGLVGRLAERVARRDLMVVRLALRLGLEGGQLQVERVRAGRPTADAERLRLAVRARLEQLRVESPVVEVAVVAESCCPIRGWQGGLLDRAEATEPLPDLCARLADALGESAVFTPVLSPSWRPEAAWERRPADAPVDPLPLRPSVVSERGRIDPVVRNDAWEADPLPPRPPLLVDRPDPIEVREVAGRPSLVRIGESWEPIRRCHGPERLSGEWWRADGGFDRIYWVVDLGVLGWIYQDARDARWYWHGWFD